MKQTAVVFLREKYISQNGLLFSEDFELAEAMEKEYLYNFYMQGKVDIVTVEERNVEQYYNETFKLK